MKIYRLGDKSFLVDDSVVCGALDAAVEHINHAHLKIQYKHQLDSVVVDLNGYEQAAIVKMLGHAMTLAL